jgi:vacuolar protein sorting-associated protein VTA1
MFRTSATLSYDKVARAQKLCKYAISALDYQDTKTAVENLTKALHLVQTGEELE